jgi:hypothetical protein
MRYLTLLTLLSVYAAPPTFGYPVNKTLKKITYKVPSGTAALVSFEGKSYLISNWHVCRHFKTQEVDASNEFYGEVVKVKVLRMYPELDTCVMTGTGKVGAKIGKFVKKGAPVYSAGYPGGVNNLVLTQGYAVDWIVAPLNFGSSERCPAGFLTINAKCEKSFQLQDTTMRGAPGCSGSAMLNSRGEYVGLVNSTNQGNLSVLNVSNVIKAIRLFKP